jgi:DNA-binding phage protein
MMPLTRDFKETIYARIKSDPKFGYEIFREGLSSLLDGDIAMAKAVMRDYVNATVGFARLSEGTNLPSKSLMRMLGPSGNPRADNLFEIVRFLQQSQGVSFEVKIAQASGAVHPRRLTRVRNMKPQAAVQTVGRARER